MPIVPRIIHAPDVFISPPVIRRIPIEILRADAARDFLEMNEPDFFDSVLNEALERLAYSRGEEAILYVPEGVDEILSPQGMALLILGIGLPPRDFWLLIKGGSNGEVAAVAQAIRLGWSLGERQGFNVAQLEGGVW